MEAQIIRAYDALDEACCNLEEASKRDIGRHQVARLLEELKKARAMRERLRQLAEQHNPDLTCYLDLPICPLERV